MRLWQVKFYDSKSSPCVIWAPTKSAALEQRHLLLFAPGTKPDMPKLITIPTGTREAFSRWMNSNEVGCWR